MGSLAADSWTMVDYIARLSIFFHAQWDSRRSRRFGSVNKEGILDPVGLTKVPEHVTNQPR